MTVFAFKAKASSNYNLNYNYNSKRRWILSVAAVATCFLTKANAADVQPAQSAQPAQPTSFAPFAPVAPIEPTAPIAPITFANNSFIPTTTIPTIAPAPAAPAAPVIPTIAVPTIAAPTIAVPTPNATPFASVPTVPTASPAVSNTSAPVAITTTPAPAPVTPTPITTTSAPIVATTAPTTSAPITPAPVTLAPVTLAPITLAPVTTAPTTSAPTTIAPTTIAPTSSTPSTLPSLIESSEPSMAPVTLSPTFPEATRSPSKEPTSKPTKTPTKRPSAEPTQPETSPPSATETDSPSTTPPTPATETETESPSSERKTPSPTTKPPTSKPTTNAPTSPLISPPTFADLAMTFTGMAPLSENDITEWQRITSNYVTTFYTFITDISNVTAIFEVTAQDPKYTATRRLQTTTPTTKRRVQTTSLSKTTTLTFYQLLTYRTSDPAATPENVVAAPFNSERSRANYIQALQDSNNDAFQYIQTVSPIQFPTKDKQGLSLIFIIGIAVGGAVLLLLVCFCCYYFVCRSNESKNGYEGGVSDVVPVGTIKGNMDLDDISTLADPTVGEKFGSNRMSSSPTVYGDQSVATVDYDYSKAYGGGGGGETVVSSSDGTFGSGTHGTKTILGDLNPPVTSYSEDSLFGTAATKEQQLDIYAPPGKLGVVIDTPDDGAPVVHAIKDSSVISNKLQVGDKLIAVDDEDVRAMTAIKVSKLISRKSANATRKLTIVRTVVMGQE